MGTKIKSLHLENYCGYRDSFFDFTDQNGDVKNLAVFFGPNGDGKSNLLYAIDLLGTASRHQGRDTSNLFRSCTFHPNYNPTYAGFYKTKKSMRITGVFEVNNGGQKEDAEVNIETSGVVKNEVPPKETDITPLTHTYVIYADKDSERRRFLLHAEKSDMFLDLARIIYDCPIELGQEIVDLEGEDYTYHLDFTVRKPDGVNVHFKRMSDGERKMAKVATGLCDPIYMNNIDIVLIDNLAMHIYFKRHTKLVDKMLSVFPDKQFIVTTHSSVIVDHIPEQCRYDIEKYKQLELDKLGPVNWDDYVAYEDMDTQNELLEKLKQLSEEIS